jgi:hypothetical protein
MEHIPVALDLLFGGMILLFLVVTVDTDLCIAQMAMPSLLAQVFCPMPSAKYTTGEI